MTSRVLRMRWTISLTALLAAGLVASSGQDAPRPGNSYKISIKDEKPVVVDTTVVPIDPTPRIRYTAQGLGVQVNDEQGRTLHLSHFPTLNIDDQMVQAGGFGGFAPNGAVVGGGQTKNLGKTPGGRERHGFQTVSKHGDLRVTLTCEVVPTKAQGSAKKRRSDSMLLRYLVENTGQKSHKFGLRVYMDVYVITNDGALFAAPTMPGKILDGIELKGKTLPDYLQLLEQPNLQNPGFVAHLTLALGNSLEKPERLVLTRHGVGFGTWDMQPVLSMGDSALGVFWEPKEIKPGGKREFGYGYGQGIVLPVEGEGQYEMQLGGSFEPGKLFTITALVADPAPGQALTLQLPEGIEPVEGRTTQPVPPTTEEQANSAVMWKARVTRPGTFPLQIRSTSGMTQTKILTVEKTAP
jgi:hypothetical protein